MIRPTVQSIVANNMAEFWARADKSLGLGPQGECWEWRGTIQKGKRYGYFKRIRAHRISWAAANGPIPDGLWVLHHCDNRICVNPSHLFLGTNDDNVRDCVAKGRKRKGENHQNAKLTNAMVRQLRAMKDKSDISAFAKSVGVHPGTAQSAALGKTWSHII